jgi:transposase
VVFNMGNKQKRRRYTASEKAEAVRLVLDSGLSHAQISRDLGLSEQNLSRWVKQGKVDAGQGPQGALTTGEKAELRKLRRENRTLRLERDFLKKAAAFFAKGNDDLSN